MKILLKHLELLIAPICALTNLTSPAEADSTANFITNTRCRSDYNINILRNKTSGELLYRSTSDNGNLSLSKGTIHTAEGVRIDRFCNGNYEYWLWGSPDRLRLETLQVYRDDRV